MSNVSTYSMYDARRPHLHVGSQVGLGRRLASTVIVRVDPREEIRTSSSPRKSKETVRGIDFDEAASEAAKKNKTPKPALTDEQLKRFAFKQKKTPAEIAQNAMEQFLQRKPTSLVSESTAAPIPVAPKVTFKPNVRSVVNQLGLSPRLPPVAKKASTSPQRKEGKRKTKRLTSFEVDSVQSKDSKPNRVPSASQNRPSSRARPSSSRQGFLRMTPLLPSLPSSSAGSGGNGASTSRTRPVTDGWDFSSSSSDDGMEDAIRFEYDVQMDSWRKVRVRIEMEEKPCNCGSRFRVFRIASHSNWPGLHADAKFVAKRLTKCAEEERERYFDVVKTQSVGRFWGQQFEEQQRAVGLSDHSICRMQFLESWVMECSDRPGKPLFVVEPMISGIRRQSLPRKEGVAQVDREQHRTVNVFAHFTWHQSAETLVIRGMEVLVAEKCLFRDPVIHSSTGYGFGTTNHGSRGVMEFLHSHTCDESCRQLQLPPMLHEIEAEQKKKRIPSAGAVKRAAEVKEFESMRSDERQESSYRLRMLTRMLEELSPQRAHPSAEFSAATPRPSFLENSSHRAHHSPVAGRADSSASTQGGPNSESFSSRSPSNGPKPVYSHTMAYIELRRQRDLAANPDSLGHADSVKSNADRAMSDFHHTNEALGSKLTVLDRSIEALKSRLGSSPAVVSEAMPESAEP